MNNIYISIPLSMTLRTSSKNHKNDEEILTEKARGVDGADVSYPGAYGGEVGWMAGFSRRERYSVPGTAPLGKRNVISNRLIELVLKIMKIGMNKRFV